jgi:hypothetical protein
VEMVKQHQHQNLKRKKVMSLRKKHLSGNLTY